MPRVPPTSALVSHWTSTEEAQQVAAHERLRRNRWRKRVLAALAVVLVFSGVLAVASYFALPRPAVSAARKAVARDSNASRIVATEAGAVELEVPEGRQRRLYRFEKAPQGWMLREISPEEQTQRRQSQRRPPTTPIPPIPPANSP